MNGPTQDDERAQGDAIPVGEASPRRGFEEIPLDLDRVPTVEEGLAAAVTRKQAFVDILKAAFGEGEEKVLFREHLPFSSFVNRATSLHLGITWAVREANPHVAFTLLRAYLELVVLVYYVDDHPEYIEALERPMWELPKNTRKPWRDLFDHAAEEMPGVGRVYATLNEMAHFGSSAMWIPFTIENDEEAHLSYTSYPRWKQPDDARIVLAMLEESDLSMAEVLRRYADHHIIPNVRAHTAVARMNRAFEKLGATPIGDSEAIGSMPEDVVAELIETGLVAWCAEHERLEPVDGVTPEQVEEWAAARSSQA